MSVNLITVQKREKELDAPGVSIRFDEEGVTTVRGQPVGRTRVRRNLFDDNPVRRQPCSTTGLFVDSPLRRVVFSSPVLLDNHSTHASEAPHTYSLQEL